MSSNGKKLFGAVLLSMVIFISWAFIYPAYSDSQDLRQAVIDRREKLTERQSISQQVFQLGQEYSNRQQQVDNFSAVIPSKKSVAELISATQGIAAGAGSQLTELAITDAVGTADTGSIGKIQISVGGKGQYASLRSFLDGLEKNLRLLDVVSFEIAPETSPGNQLKFSIKANAYYLK